MAAVLLVVLVLFSVQFNSVETLRDKVTLSSFTDWLVHNGGKVNGVTLAPIPEYEIGIVATQDLKEGDIVLEIPWKCTITKRNLLDQANTKISKHFRKAMGDLQYLYPKELLAVTLMHERSRDPSFWDTYLEILPTYSFKRRIPLFWKDSELKYLEASYLSTLITRKKEDLQASYRNIFTSEMGLVYKYPHMFNLEHYSFKLYEWAISMVESRALNIPEFQNEEDFGLIPFADFFNHAPEKAVGHPFPIEPKVKIQVSQSSILFEVTGPIQKDEQIFLNYFPRLSNNLLLLNYGFLFPPPLENPYDYFMFPLFIEQSKDSLRYTKAKELGTLGYATAHYLVERNVTLDKNWVFPNYLLRAFRLVASDQKIFEETLAGVKPFSDQLSWDDLDLKDRDEGRISISNERKTLRMLAKVIRDIRGRYTTLEEEDLLQMDLQSNKNHKNALAIRYQDKKILRALGEDINEKRRKLQQEVGGSSEK